METLHQFVRKFRQNSSTCFPVSFLLQLMSQNSSEIHQIANQFLYCYRCLPKFIKLPFNFFFSAINVINNHQAAFQVLSCYNKCHIWKLFVFALTFTWNPNLSYCSISLTSGIWSTNILGEFFLHFEMSHFENTFSSSCHEQLSWSHFENTFSNSWGCCVVSGKRARLFSSEVYEKPSGIYIIHYISYIIYYIYYILYIVYYTLYIIYHAWLPVLWIFLHPYFIFQSECS